VGALALDMSGSAPRTAGSDHYAPLIFAASLPGAGSVCQPVVSLPRDAARVQLTIGTYGKPVPALTLRFLDPAGRASAEGYLAAGAHEGLVSIPVHDISNPEAATDACVEVERSSGPIVLGGEGVPVTSFSERVDGKPESGRLSLEYFRAGSESWWQLLPTLDERFGFGKAPFFGAWLLPFAALALLGVWIATIRLLVQQLSRARSS
jgi:hypothetical protein